MLVVPDEVDPDIRVLVTGRRVTKRIDGANALPFGSLQQGVPHMRDKTVGHTSELLRHKGKERRAFRIQDSRLISCKNYVTADVMSVRVKSSPLNNNGSFIAFASA